MKFADSWDPMTEVDHVVLNCDLGMSCPICMKRCYKQAHIYWNGKDNCCDCRKFNSIEEELQNAV